MHPNEHCNCRYADVGCDRMEQVMDQISGKWKMRILFMVGAHGTLRYGELRKLLDGVTHKMLSNQLKELAADGLVQLILVVLLMFLMKPAPVQPQKLSMFQKLVSLKAELQLQK